MLPGSWPRVNGHTTGSQTPGARNRRRFHDADSAWPGRRQRIVDTARLVLAELEKLRADGTKVASYVFGKPVSALMARMNAEVDRFDAADDWGTALLVLHGAVNRVILSRALTGRAEFLGHSSSHAGALASSTTVRAGTPTRQPHAVRGNPGIGSAEDNGRDDRALP